MGIIEEKPIKLNIHTENIPEINEELVNRVLSRTLGANIIPTPALSSEQYYREKCILLENLLKSRLKNNEYISWGISIPDGKETCSIRVFEEPNAK